MAIIWESKSLSKESIQSLFYSTSDNRLNPTTSYIDNGYIRVKFDGSCLKQEKITFNPGHIIMTLILHYDIVYLELVMHNGRIILE